MLAVVSAVVAFDRWPGQSVSSPLQTLVLTEQPAPIRIGTPATGASATGRRVAGAATGTRRVAGGRLGVAGEHFSSGVRNAGTPAAPTGPAGTVLPQLPPPPGLPTPDTILNQFSNPGTTASQLADSAQSVTDSAGVGVARVSPELGDAVVATGENTAQAIRGLPLPGHVIPGH